MSTKKLIILKNVTFQFICHCRQISASIFMEILVLPIVVQGFPFPGSYMLFWHKFSDVVTVRQKTSTYTRYTNATDDANTDPCSHLDVSSRSQCWRYPHLRLKGDSVRLNVEITSQITSLARPSNSPITALPVIRCSTISAIQSFAGYSLL